MLTVFFYCTGKPGSRDALRALIQEMTAVTRAEGPGCVTYVFHQREDAPDEYLLHEQWQDQAALKSHIANMYAHFGAPPQGAVLPARMHELVERHHGRYYAVMA